MMAITHVLVGLLLAVPVALVAPEYATAAGVGAIVGGIIPDLDLFAGVHRKTLHYPVAGPVVGVAAGVVAVVAPSPVTVGIALALLSAGVHATTDIFGAGEELRPWERTNPYAVYDHVNGRWLRARYLVPYDGAPRDLLVALLCAVPVALTFRGEFRWLLAGLLLVAVVYTALRRRLVPHFEAMLE
ncbi:metal-dependent hydrolase [Halolamina sp.]|uniref:metal-dependent hydrolase n=1 Tax=Halolamina sp. TaxID=1940283 RepID=UPI003563E085